MYGKYNSLADALAVFTAMPHQTEVSWNALLTAYGKNGYGKETLQIFYQMQVEGLILDKVAFLGALSACTSLATLELGHHIHSILIEEGHWLDSAITNTIITMYGVCGSLDDAKNVFYKSPNRDTVTWSSMIGVCCQASRGEEALDLFYQMYVEDVKPNKIMLVCVLESCAALGAYEQGHQVHSCIVQLGLDKDVVVDNALVDLYGKCGSLPDARGVFDAMNSRDAISWTCMIAGFAYSGCSKEAFKLFCKMQLEGLRPDKATYLCMLSAFNHTGEVDDSKHLFVSVARDGCLLDSKDPSFCMVDLLGRAGQLDEAEGLITRVPAESVSAAWLCLLGGCRIHSDMKRGENAAGEISKIESNSSTLFVMLSNLYATSGIWTDDVGY